MTRPPLTRIIARLEHQFGGRLLDQLPHGVRFTALGVAVADQARRILREFDATKEMADPARSGRTGTFRVTSKSTVAFAASSTVGSATESPGGPRTAHGNLPGLNLHASHSLLRLQPPRHNVMEPPSP